MRSQRALLISHSYRGLHRGQRSLTAQTGRTYDGVDAPSRRHQVVPGWKLQTPAQTEEASVEKITIISIDLAKRVFQLHGATAEGQPMLRKKVSRSNCCHS